MGRILQLQRREAWHLLHHMSSFFSRNLVLLMSPLLLSVTLGEGYALRMEEHHQPQASKHKSGAIADDDIRMVVEAALLSDSRVPENAINVKVQDGIVSLDGKVSHLLAKERTVLIVETIKGVRGIVSNISITPNIPPDRRLRQNILQALAKDPAADAYEIHVDVHDGIVRLEGTVESWQEKQLSEDVVKGVTGVIEVENNLDWDPVSKRLDSEIEADVRGRLKADPWVAHEFIDVKVEDGKVALSGGVGSLDERRRVKADAWVAGVKTVNAEDLRVEWRVRNNLKRTSMEIKSDEEIVQAIQDAWNYDPRVNVEELQVAVDGGAVTLTGVVDNLKSKNIAEEDARNTVGVWRVRNFIKVRPQEPLSDEEIAENVKTVLQLDPFLEENEIAVSVNNGHVFLTGSVEYNYEKARAQDIVSRVKGVVKVTNFIDVLSEWTWRSDLEIQNEITTELWWSPFVDSDEVTVTVEQGVATLTGVVDSWTERTIAEENAYEGGAKDVVNKLQLRPMVEG